MLKSIFFAALLALVLARQVQAETIHLKSGPHIKGKIIQSSSDSVTIEKEDDHSVLIINKEDIFLINFKSKEEEKADGTTKKSMVSVIYLRNGEIVKGIIKEYAEGKIVLESTNNMGSLNIPLEEINMITAADRNNSMNQRTGIGYKSHKSTLSTGTPVTYNSDQLSYKFFLEENLFSDILFAFGSSTTPSNTQEVFAVDYRMGQVFDRFQNILLYYGGQVGYLTVTDTSAGVSGSGYTLGGFVGAEMFFNSMPNFGFAAELGLTMQTVGSSTFVDLSSSSFPALSVHYYF